MTAVANHLWQSTLFALVVWLVALALKNQRAQIRYALWLAASVKFLIPFSLVAAAAAWIPWSAPPAASPQAVIVYTLNQPFSPPPSFHPASAPTPTPQSPLPAVWFLGAAAVGTSWMVRWWRLAKLARRASPVSVRQGIPVMSSPARIEPGVFGILRPVLILPAGIAGHLSNQQLDAVIEHELCHVRRRDNLAAAIHMIAEAVFWFHPLVWWIEAQLVKERERACDEEVLARGSDPQAYAEAILKTCRFYIESPLSCVAGVTGSDLRRRIEEIMSRPSVRNLDFGRKLLLAAAGLAAIAAPVTVAMRAQPAERLAFEVASIKESKATDPRQMGIQFLPGGRFSAKGIPLVILVQEAYDLPFQSDRITGWQDWMLKTRYDIEATGVIPAGATVRARNEKMRLMLQTLLAERFKMVVRRETKERAVYAITVGKGGPKLQRASVEEKDCTDSDNFGDPTACHSFGGGQGRGIHAQAGSISDLASWVSNWADRPVIDKTGITGLFKIETEGWSPMRPRLPRPPDQEPTAEDRAFSDPSTPTLFVIFDRLGLKLESSKAPIETFVIESAERPTEN
jgi:bla regulator protein BlaR1